MYLEISGLCKSYGEGESYQQVLKGITTSMPEGKLCAILGASGSGKSTLLHCIGGLEPFDTGSIQVDGTELAGLDSEALLEYRRENLGFVFQFYNLVQNLTVMENVQVCEYLAEQPLDVKELLEVLGLEKNCHKFPSQLSGGQQQRCAIARALVKNPKLLLCDEPTGALDSGTAKEILMLLEKINQTYNTTILLVTHNQVIRQMVDRVLLLRDGQLTEAYDNKQKIPAAQLLGL